MARSTEKFNQGTAGLVGSIGVGTSAYGLYEFMRHVKDIPSIKGGVLESMANGATRAYNGIASSEPTNTNTFFASTQQVASLPVGNLSLFVSGALAAYAGYQFSKNPMRGTIMAAVAGTIPCIARAISQIPETASQTASYLLQSNQIDPSQYTSGTTIAGVVISCGLAGLLASLTKEIGDGERVPR